MHYVASKTIVLEHWQFGTGDLITTVSMEYSIPKTFVCDLCAKSFSKSSNLTQHIRIHTGEKPFQCELCGKCFRQSGNLSKHLKGHENAHLRWNRECGDKPFKCEFQGCRRSFTAKNSLQKHFVTHFREMPYECPHTNCDSHFARRSHLKMHLREHRINSSLKPNSEQCRIPVGQIGRMGRPCTDPSTVNLQKNIAVLSFPDQLFSDAAQSDEEDLESEGEGEGEDEECAASEVRVPLTSPGNGNGLSVPTVSIPQKRQRNNGDSEDDLDDALFFLADVLAAGPSPGSVMPRAPSENQLLHKEPHHQEPQPQQQQPQQQPQKQEGEEDLDGDDMKFLEFLDQYCKSCGDDSERPSTFDCDKAEYFGGY